MKLFRVAMLGEDFPLGMDGDDRLMGFYVTRWITAEDRIEAATKALAQLKGEPALAGVPSGCGARITYEEIAEAEPGEAPPDEPGLAIFPME